MRPNLFTTVVILAGATLSVQPQERESGSALDAQRVESRAGELELEPGLMRVDTNWFQDQFGLALDQYLRLEAERESPEILCVRVRSTALAGIALELRFRIAGDQVTECIAAGRWRTDFGSKPSDFAGELRGVTGLARVRLAREREPSSLQCIFLVRGQGRKSREMIMGGFAVPIPEAR